MSKLVLIIILLSVTLTAFAQQEKYDAATDKKSYELYLRSKWEELREVGTTAIDNGIDFYYLRMRLGISYYEEKNFASSIQHFEKATMFNPKDSTALEYLYYSYLFSGQVQEATLLSRKLSSQLKRKVNYKQPEFIKGVYSEGGYSFNSDYGGTKNKSIKGNQDLSGTQSVFKDETYINISLLNSIGERVSVFHGYNNIVVNSTQQFEDGISGKKEFQSSVKQNEYYINLGFYLGKGFNLTTAFHYLNINLEYYQPPTNTSQVFLKTTTTSNDNVLNFSLSKRLGHTELGMTTVFGSLNGGKQNQSTFTVIWYPFGNLNLYNMSNFSVHTNKNDDSSSAVTRVLFDEKLGFKVSDKLWIEAVFTTGPIFNYSESNAFIIYNNVDKIKYKAGINIISPISNNVELSLRYLFMSQEYDITTTNSNAVTTKTNIFLIHKLIGGIKWTF